MKKIETNQLSPEAKKSMVTRIITALVMVAITVPCLILGNWLYFGFIVLITGLAGYELVHITKIEGKLKIAIYIITISLLILLVNYIFFKNNWSSVVKGENIDAWRFVTNGFENIELSSMLIILTAAIFFIFSFVTEKMTIQYVLYFITMIIVVSLGIQSFLYLRFAPYHAWQVADKAYFDSASFPYFESLTLVLYLALGVTMNDIGAYFVGMLFGKHKMNPRISPKKTWEGFVGGIVFSAIISITFALVLALVKKPIHPHFTLQEFYWPVIISLIMPLIGDVGDFIFSAIKRNEGIKDFSNLLPGHGGILDRIDSLLFAGGAVAAMIAFIDFVAPIIEKIPGAN